MVEERKFFTIQELKIISEFESGISIRKLTETYEGFGRTKIKNLLIEYVRVFPEKSEEIERLLLSNKTHKSKEEIDEIKNRPDLTDEEIRDIYERIRKGESLTSLSEEYERTRDYLKKRVIEYLDDENDIQELLNILRDNQNRIVKNKYLEFLQSTNPVKLTTVFNRLNARKAKTSKKQYSFLMLTRKYSRLKEYLLIERNSRIENEDERLSEEDFWKMLYDTPTLLSGSLTDKIRPVLESLDNHPDVGMKNATRIIRDDSSILFSSISRTRLQLRILKDSGLLEVFFAKPRNFRTSPELVYALIKFSQRKEGETPVGSIFLSKKQLEERFGITPEDLISQFDVKAKYEDDEYFERR